MRYSLDNNQLLTIIILLSNINILIHQFSIKSSFNMENDKMKCISENEINNDEKSIYHVSDNLSEEGWEYDNNKVYIPFNDCDKKDIFLSISRKKSKTINIKYMWCQKKDNKTFKNLAAFERTKLLNGEEIEAKGKASINKKLSNAGRNSQLTVEEGGYKSFFSEIFNKIITSDCLKVLKDENYVFPEEHKEEADEENNYLSQITEDIQYRQKPKLTNIQEVKARKVAKIIKNKGLVGYLKPELDKLHIGEHRNIYRKTLGAFNVMRGKGSYIFETTAEAEAGKSLEDEIVFSYIIPDKYIINKNSISESSFTRLSDMNEEFFTRLIVNFGDLGGEKAYAKVQDVFDIIKVLITENSFSKDLSEKSTSGNFINKTLNLEVESIGAVYSTVHNSFTNGDSQLESRTINSTPFDADKTEIMNRMLYLNTSLSKESKDKEEAIKELIKFKCYLLSLVNFDEEIINPYGSVFKRYVNESNTPLRELKQLLEFFDAYCILTHEDCDIINDNLVASKTQLESFFSEICLESVLIPYESNFIQMLLAKDKATELVLIDDSINEEENDLDPLNEYYNNALENIVLYDSEEHVTYYTELDDYRQKIFVNKLIQLYKLGKSSSEHRKNVFFRLGDIKRRYYRYKAYKDIDDVSKLLYTLQIKGYLGKLDFNDPNTKQNIYYATTKCENITVSFKLTENDKEEADKFLEKIGVR